MMGYKARRFGSIGDLTLEELVPEDRFYRHLEQSLDLSPERAAALEAQNQQRHDWYALGGEPDRSIQRGTYQRVSDLWVSVTDPDAVLMKQHGHGTRLR